jgi:hypothetical protein
MANRSKETATQAADAGRVEGRKLYTAPTLRRLGSVRELTLGQTGCIKEAKAGSFMGM